MANYCSNSIVFYSKDRLKLARFLRKVYAAFDSIGSGFYNLLVLHGYTNRQISGMIDRRDTLTYCDSKLATQGDTYSFKAETETAWVPHMELFYKILRDNYGNLIRMVYQSIETGCGIYINTDKDGKYLPERYMIDCFHDGDYHTEYFETYEEAIDWINKEYPTFSFSRFDDLEEVETRLQQAYSYDTNCFFYFHRFESDDGFNLERSVA